MFTSNPFGLKMSQAWPSVHLYSLTASLHEFFFNSCKGDEPQNWFLSDFFGKQLSETRIKKRPFGFSNGIISIVTIAFKL